MRLQRRDVSPVVFGKPPASGSAVRRADQLIGAIDMAVCVMVGPSEGEPRVEIRKFGTFRAELEGLKRAIKSFMGVFLSVDVCLYGSAAVAGQPRNLGIRQSPQQDTAYELRALGADGVWVRSPSSPPIVIVKAPSGTPLDPTVVGTVPDPMRIESSPPPLPVLNVDQFEFARYPVPECVPSTLKWRVTGAMSVHLWTRCSSKFGAFVQTRAGAHLSRYSFDEDGRAGQRVAVPCSASAEPRSAIGAQNRSSPSQRVATLCGLRRCGSWRSKPHAC
jgi:hypothetical protein